MDIKAFFKRIGLPEGTPVSASYEFLRDVQYNAVLKIAYENLEILEGKPLALDADSLFVQNAQVAFQIFLVKIIGRPGFNRFAEVQQ